MTQADPPGPDPELLAYALADAARRRRRGRGKRAARARPAQDPPRVSPMQRKGYDYEDRALELLSGQGLALLERNLSVAAGEIDLAMRHGDTLVLVEVRARADGRYGGAAASIDRAKQRRLANAATLLLPRLARRHWRGRIPSVRFDAVLFENDRPQWIRGAFTIGA
jgi:putative endonuclease